MPDPAVRQGFSRADLRRRGWSRVLIDAELGPPDWIVPNPYYPNGAFMQLYDRPHVEQAETMPAFVALQEKAK